MPYDEMTQRVLIDGQFGAMMDVSLTNEVSQRIAFGLTVYASRDRALSPSPSIPENSSTSRLPMVVWRRGKRRELKVIRLDVRNQCSPLQLLAESRER